MEERHVRLFRCSVTLRPVALSTAATKVVPGPRSAPALRQDVVQRKNHFGWFAVDDPCRTFLGSAVLTQVSVSCVDVWPRKDRNPDRDFFVVPQSDNARKGETRVYFDSVILFCDCRAFDQKLQSVLCPSDTHRFERAIKHKHGFVD